MAFEVLSCLLVALLASAAASPMALPDSRIVGGAPARIEDFPFAVSIEYFYPGANVTVQRCVGTLITSWNVVTSAFCVNGTDLDNMRVRASTNSSLSGGLVRRVHSVTIHPNYTESPRAMDLAVMVLFDPLVITETVYIAYLPPQNTSLPDGLSVQIASWGFDNDTQLSNLAWVESNIIPQEKCQETYAASNNNTNATITISDDVLCASSNGTSICFGDSGAPLVYNNTLLGISSLYYTCDDSTPDIFTRIDRFSRWILDHAFLPSENNTNAFSSMNSP